MRWLAGTQPLSARQRIAVSLVTLLLCAIVVEGAPRFTTKRLRLLLAARAESPDPAWDIPVNGDAFRRASTVVRGRSTYYVLYPPAERQYAHDLLAAGLLLLTPALPVRYPADADWLIAYRTAPKPPTGVRGVRTVRVTGEMSLMRTGR